MPSDETKKDYYEEFVIRLVTLTSRFYPDMEIVVGEGEVKLFVVSQSNMQDYIACYVVSKITEQKIAVFFKLYQSNQYTTAVENQLNVHRWIMIQDYLVHKDDKVAITSIIQDTLRVVNEIKHLRSTAGVERGITRF